MRAENLFGRSSKCLNVAIHEENKNKAAALAHLPTAQITTAASFYLPSTCDTQTVSHSVRLFVNENRTKTVTNR